MTIFSEVDAALATLNVPYAYDIFLTGTGEALPDTFLVYFLIVDSPEQFADNQMTEHCSYIQVSVWSRDGFGNDLVERIQAAMETAGFMPGSVTKLPYDQVTRHFGLSLEFSKMRGHHDS